MKNKAILTCLSVNCPERKSICCGAISTAVFGRRDTAFVCSNCRQPYQGGKCTAGEDMSTIRKRYVKTLPIPAKDREEFKQVLEDYQVDWDNDMAAAGIEPPRDPIAWLSLKRKEWMDEGYVKGYKEGSGGIAADVLSLHDQYEKGYQDATKRYNAMQGEVIKMRIEEARSEERERIDRLEVQLAGCGVAALGGTKQPARKGDFGWSQSYQDVLELRIKYDGQPNT